AEALRCGAGLSEQARDGGQAQTPLKKGDYDDWCPYERGILYLHVAGWIPDIRLRRIPECHSVSKRGKSLESKKSRKNRLRL
ncbi:MAG: hypothetical protein JSU72_20755, partial [Deltaproteobacteria bacterium]